LVILEKSANFACIKVLNCRRFKYYNLWICSKD